MSRRIDQLDWSVSLKYKKQGDKTSPGKISPWARRHQEAFLEKYKEYDKNIKRACVAVGIERDHYKFWMCQQTFKMAKEEIDLSIIDEIVAKHTAEARQKGGKMATDWLKKNYAEVYGDKVAQTSLQVNVAAPQIIFKSSIPRSKSEVIEVEEKKLGSGE